MAMSATKKAMSDRKIHFQANIREFYLIINWWYEIKLVNKEVVVVK